MLSGFSISSVALSSTCTLYETDFEVPASISPISIFISFTSGFNTNSPVSFSSKYVVPSATKLVTDISSAFAFPSFLTVTV